MSVRYPERYFDAAPGEGDVLFTITPSENNKFAERAIFEAHFAESVEAALAALTEPETVEWTAGALSGTIGVARDETQDPPVATTVGAFALDDGRAVVLSLTATGKYGWDLWSQVYTSMLDMLAVTRRRTPRPSLSEGGLMLRLYSWNVNGIRAAHGRDCWHGFHCSAGRALPARDQSATRPD